jgi:hypothetical protein
VNFCACAEVNNTEFARTRVGAVQISTDRSPIERRVGVACKIAKWKTGGEYKVEAIFNELY